MREALLALLSKEPSHGYELHQRLSAALGPAEAELNPGQVYVALSRLERGGLVRARDVPQGSRPDKKVYEVTAAGRELVGQWLADLAWRRPAPVEFHLKLVAAATTGLADPIALIDAQRRELLRRLGELQRAIATAPPPKQPDAGPAGPAGTSASAGAAGAGMVLLEGAALRLEADLRWLDVCERHWLARS